MNKRANPRRPSPALMLSEGPRAVSEIASLFASAPFLNRAPRGDGHSVLVMPGFGAGDRSTTVLRAFLRSRGYQAQPWNLGRNIGPAFVDLPEKLSQRLEDVFVRGGNNKVSLVGWSLGGVYARMLAHLFPAKVRQVITLGSPFAGHPRSTSIYPLIRGMRGMPRDGTARGQLRALAAEPLPGIPGSAIFSKTDGIVPWRIATQRPSEIAENIEVYTSHIGLGVSAAVMYATADRLAQPEGQWQPFDRRGWKRWLYGPARLDDTAAFSRRGS